MDSLAISISHGLQYGVPLKSYVKTLRGTSFPPAGLTNDPDIQTATSIVDYIIRRLALDYLNYDDQLELGMVSFMSNLSNQQLEISDQVVKEGKDFKPESVKQPDSILDINAPLCFNCGNQTQRSGSCYVCSSCGSTTGCS